MKKRRMLLKSMLNQVWASCNEGNPDSQYSEASNMIKLAAYSYHIRYPEILTVMLKCT